MPLPRPATLRAQFGLRAFLLALIALGLATFATGWLWRARALDAVAEGLNAHIHSIEADLELDLATDLDSPTTDRPMLLPAPEVGVQIVSQESGVLAASSRLLDRAPLIPVGDVTATGTATSTVTDAEFGHALINAELVIVAGRRFVIEAIAGLDDVDSAARITWLVFPLVAILLSALIGFAVSISVDRALRPVGSLAGRAAEIAAGRRPLRLDVRARTTELRDLAAQLDRLLDSIRASFDREQAFLDDAAHELRTPIAIAQTELDLAHRSAPDQQTAEALRSALDELHNLDRTAADLLVLARARVAGREAFVPVDLGKVAQRAAAVVRRDPRQRHVPITVRGSGLVLGDPDGLQRALTNVIANAARFCTTSVVVEVDASSEGVTTTITDDGPGIPDHLLSTLFDRFARGPAREVQSTGLGTAIAAEVVASHSGTITAHNRREGGAVVTIRLPATNGAQPPSPSEGAADRQGP
jgi:two-component system OmpR family sensor kinase